MRHAMETDEIMMCIVINGKKLPHENELCERLIAVENRIKTIVININCDKTNVITGKECRTIFEVDILQTSFVDFHLEYLLCHFIRLTALKQKSFIL